VKRRLLSAALIACSVATAAHAQESDPSIYRVWIEEMKSSPRGPFSGIGWFCNDGTVHPARPYPCGTRGGGVQHGEWNARVKRMRENAEIIIGTFHS
jgi:hypothetical protein